MARRRRRRTGEGADNLDELEDDDDLDIRITSVEEELQNISLSSLNQQRETQSLRVKLDKLAAELKEGEGEDDEVFNEIDQAKALINQLNEQVTGAQAVLIDRLNTVVTRMDQVGGLGPLEEVPAQIERRIDEQLRYLTERLEERLASMEAAREEESDLAATRIEELSSQVEGVINALRDEMEQVLLDTRQTFANDLEAVNLAIQSGGNVQEQVQALGAELQGRLTTLTGEIEQNLNALESTVGASLEASQQEVQEALSQIRGELAPLADLQANMTDVVEALDTKAGAEELAELRQSLDDLKKAVSDTASLSEKSRHALELVNKLETSVTTMDERYARIAKASEDSANKAEAHQDKVNLAVKLVDALEEKVRGGGFGSGSSSLSAEPITDEDLDTPEKTELGFELKDLLQVMVKHQASDLHLKVGAPPTVRLEGELIPVGNANLGGEDCRRLVFSALSRPNRRQLLSKKCLDFTYEMAPGTRFRANAFLERGHLSAAFKMVRAEIPGLEELGLPGITKKLASFASGLVLVAGPYGSNTPLAIASMVEFINTTRKIHIVTLEDPIEFYYKNKQTCIITQREIGNDVPSFKVAIKEALRQDPDVIALSDIPDPETMLAAVNAADSGRLVLAGMNTASAVQTLDRILDGFVGATQRQIRMQLASSLRGVLCLRLLPRADRKGRVYATEVLVGNAAVSQAVLEGRLGELFQYMQSSTAEGMQTLAQSLARLFEAGLITKEEAVAHHVGGNAEAAMAASYASLPPAQPVAAGPPLGTPAAAGAAPAATPPAQVVAAPQPSQQPPQQPPAAAMSEDTLMNWL